MVRVTSQTFELFITWTCDIIVNPEPALLAFRICSVIWSWHFFAMICGLFAFVDKFYRRLVLRSNLLQSMMCVCVCVCVWESVARDVDLLSVHSGTRCHLRFAEMWVDSWWVTVCWLVGADDAWINVSAEQLDKMLAEMSGRPAAQINDLQQLSDSMNIFINKVSSHEGAELPGSVLQLLTSLCVTDNDSATRVQNCQGL